MRVTYPVKRKPMNKFVQFINNIDWIYIIFSTIISLVLLFILYAFFMLAIDFKNEAFCLSLGFPGHNTTFNGIGYCIRTINQTQYVIPIKELLK